MNVNCEADGKAGYVMGDATKLRAVTGTYDAMTWSVVTRTALIRTAQGRNRDGGEMMSLVRSTRGRGWWEGRGGGSEGKRVVEFKVGSVPKIECGEYK